MKRLLLLLIIIAGLAVGLFAAYQPGSVNFIIGDYWIQIPLWLFLATKGMCSYKVLKLLANSIVPVVS